ncbi:hypothetical protein KTAU_26270 [Thermogemmatispora aurantia]|uniref:Uncharacterized protein n=1 Tax=Thermogemmatispora aurantia TaxID=2045279 RepID=A0A5J4KBD5_9CHLR|nr:hypothetical protein KTAU_26270 [Thermogemmatispora aurantia]
MGWSPAIAPPGSRLSFVNDRDRSLLGARLCWTSLGVGVSEAPQLPQKRAATTRSWQLAQVTCSGAPALLAGLAVKVAPQRWQCWAASSLRTPQRAQQRPCRVLVLARVT